MEYKKFRYDFSDDVTKMLGEFANNNREKSRKEFTQIWEEYIAEEKTSKIIKDEIEMMRYHGFCGDVMDKMYKSVRYYHRKRDIKTLNVDQDINKNKHENRFSREFLKMMDKYILEQMTDHENIKHSDETGRQINTLSQSESYQTFCEKNKEKILEEFIKIRKQTGRLTEMVVDKIKKTYKNRFYNCRKL